MSPEVWSAAKGIILNTATGLGVPVELPNERFAPPHPPSIWISTDLGGEASETIELGGLTWIERGAVWIHVMAALNIGVDLSLAYRKAFSVAFRRGVPTLQGLHWRDHSFDPLGADDGVWRRLSVAVRYEFDDRLSDSESASAQLGGSGSVT